MILALDFYGVACRIECPPGLGEKIRKDFAYFVIDGTPAGAPDITLSFHREAPSFGRVPAGMPSLRRADWTAYDRGALRFVDYGGKALGTYDYRGETGSVCSEDDDLLHELAYLMIQSRAGELLDRKGIHRVHALGVTFGGRGILCLLPQGGGKTTLCLELLKENGVGLLSDDTPLIDRGGKILPFPVRIGVCPPAPRDVPSSFLSEFKRRRYGPKTLIDIAYYRDRIGPAADPSVVLVGERSTEPGPRLEKTGRQRAAIPFLANCVAGIGLPQVMEYFVRLDAADMAGKMRIAHSRMRASAAVLCRSQIYRFTLGTDTRRNAECLLSALWPGRKDEV